MRRYSSTSLVIALFLTCFSLIAGCGLTTGAGDELLERIAVDFDSDLVVNGTDNCPHHYNPGQEDTDWDTIGDHCDISEGWRHPDVWPTSAMNKLLSTR